MYSLVTSLTSSVKRVLDRGFVLLLFCRRKLCRTHSHERIKSLVEVAEGLSVGSNVLEGQVLGKTGTKTAHLHIDATGKKGKGIDPENRNYGTVSNKFFFEQLGGDHKLLKTYKDTLTPVTATTDKTAVSENKIVEEEEKNNSVSWIMN